MTRTQIQLPDELYQRAKAFAEQKELSLAEVARRGIELFLARFPQAEPAAQTWKLPAISAGSPMIALDELKRAASEDEGARGQIDE